MTSKADQHPERVRWFGPTWRAPICDPDYQTLTPVGQPCIFCDRLFVFGDQGLSMYGEPRSEAHLNCLVDSVVGRGR